MWNITPAILYPWQKNKTWWNSQFTRRRQILRRACSAHKSPKLTTTTRRRFWPGFKEKITSHCVEKHQKRKQPNKNNTTQENTHFQIIFSLFVKNRSLTLIRVRDCVSPVIFTRAGNPLCGITDVHPKICLKRGGVTHDAAVSWQRNTGLELKVKSLGMRNRICYRKYLK